MTITNKLLGLVDGLALLFGYVPAHRLTTANSRLLCLEQQFRQKTRDLEHQWYLRQTLESEIHFLRELELARLNNNTDTQKAIQRLDDLCSRLDNFLSEYTVCPPAD